MIIDTSALVAIVAKEPDHEPFSRALTEDTASMSAATYLESAIVLDRRNQPRLGAEFDRLVATLDIAIRPVTAAHARIARQAYRDFGKGSGHRAQLNFGDCFSYALAIESAEPLLYKGDDFGHTAVRSAL